MKWFPVLVKGKLGNSDVIQQFVDVKSAATWCTSHKDRNATFILECEGKKIATITYRKPFHVVETPSKGTKKL